VLTQVHMPTQQYSTGVVNHQEMFELLITI
jgi:hypothetical protein